MNKQVMIYEIKSSADSNSGALFHQNGKFFYWNQKKFNFLIKEDYVIVVNTHSKYVLLTKLVSKDISIELDDTKNTSSFNDKNQNFIVDGKYKDFVRLQILGKYDLPNNWVWKSLGASETTYLNGNRTKTKASANRITNITQLKELSEDKVFHDILNTSLSNFTGENILKNVEKTKPTKNKMKNQTEIETAIQTKPFIILAGISGTGKSRLVRQLAFKTCNDELLKIDQKKPGNYELIPVKPNWHDSSDLLGYISRINGEKYITSPFLKFIAKAWKYPKTPFFLCLDEMNLAPVEQYFAEYLSVIETRSSTNGIVETDAILDIDTIGKNNLIEFLSELNVNETNDNKLFKQFTKKGIQIPNNLVVMGTVNMDETTHSFSRKVLDRAMTIEMNNVDLSAGLDLSKNDLSYNNDVIKYDDIIGNITIGAEIYKEFKDSKKVIHYLNELNEILDGSPFKVAYRVRDEFLIYCYHNSIKKGKLKNALDQLTVMKVLSRIEGDESKVKEVLTNLNQLFTNKDFFNSKSKIEEMINRLKYGYTSFWS